MELSEYPVMKLTRYYKGGEYTRGILTDSQDSEFLLHTLELPWKGNRRSVSCIPVGVYTVRPFSGGRFVDAYKVNDVPNRTAILFHVGNTTNDIEGCILIGKSCGELGGDKAVLDSRKAFEHLSKHIGHTGFILHVNEV